MALKILIGEISLKLTMEMMVMTIYTRQERMLIMKNQVNNKIKETEIKSSMMLLRKIFDILEINSKNLDFI